MPSLSHQSPPVQTTLKTLLRMSYSFFFLDTFRHDTSFESSPYDRLRLVICHKFPNWTLRKSCWVSSFHSVSQLGLVDVKWASQIIFHLGKNIFSANAFSTKAVKNRINTNAVKMFIFSANQF